MVKPVGAVIWRCRALTIPFVARPGTTWNYWQTGPAMLAASVSRAAGEDFQTFAQRELFGPIGIKPGGWTWTRDAAGNTAGFWGLFMTPDDFGRLGEVLRRDGVWRGKRLLSKQYVQAALQLTKPFGCYGMLIWRQATPRKRQESDYRPSGFRGSKEKICRHHTGS